MAASPHRLDRGVTAVRSKGVIRLGGDYQAATIPDLAPELEAAQALDYEAAAAAMPLWEAPARVPTPPVPPPLRTRAVAAGYELSAEAVTDGGVDLTFRFPLGNPSDRGAWVGLFSGTHENAFNSRGWVEAERRVRHKYIGKNSEEATMKFSKSLLGKVPPGDYFFVLSTNNFGEDEGGGQVRAEKGLRVGDPHADARELALELIAPTFSADAASDTAPYPTGDAADGGRYTDMDVMAVVKSPPLRMKRKCGTPGCTLEDFHLGPCTLDNKVNDDGGRAKREVKSVKEEEPPAPKGKVEPPWKFQTELDELGAGGPIRRRPPRRAPLMTAAERREAAVATDFLAKWSAQEEELFALGRMLYGKDLRAVATLLPNKTPAELVEYYYLRKRPAPPPPSSARRAAKEEEEVEVELPREANCTKCGHHRVVARRCTAAGCTTAVCGRCIYNPALVPKGHTESVKNAWWRCDACVTSLCESTPKGSALHGAHGVCASCGDVKPTRLLSDHPWLHTPMCLPCLGALCCACAMVTTDGAPPDAAAAPPASPSLAAASSSSASSTATAGASDANACTVGDGDDDDPWFCQWCGGHDGRTAFKCGGDDCNHSVCQRCLLRNGGAAKVEEVQRDPASFRCAICEPRLRKQGSQLPLPDAFNLLTKKPSRPAAGAKRPADGDPG